MKRKRNNKKLRNILLQVISIFILSSIIFSFLLFFNNKPNIGKEYILQKKLITETCVKNIDFKDNHLCIERELTTLAEEKSDINYCYLIENTIRKHECMKDIVLEIAINEKNSKKCDILISPYNCKSVYFQEIAKQEKDLSFLDEEIKNNLIRIKIHDLLIFEETISSGDCSRLKTKNMQNYCKKEYMEHRSDN